MADSKQFNGVVNFKAAANLEGTTTVSGNLITTGTHTHSGTEAHSGTNTFSGELVQSGTFTANGVDIIDSAQVATLLLGLNPQWNLNFGGETVRAAGGSEALTLLDVLTPVNTMFRLSLALVKLAEQTEVVSATSAGRIFGGTGVTGTDVAIAAAVTPFVDQRVTRLTGGISGTVVMTAAADLTGAGAQSMLLFTGNTCASSGILKLTMHADNELKASSSEACESGDFALNAGQTMTKSTAPTDADQVIILTDTGDCTILAGSYIYVHTGNETDQVALKACIRTTGGTIAVTYAA